MEKEVTSIPRPEQEKAQTTGADSEASKFGTERIEPPKPPKLTGNVDEDVIELLRHAAWRSAYRTQEVGYLVNYLKEIQKEIQKELGMGNSDNIVDQLRSLRQNEVRFQLLQEQQNMINNTMARMREQHELARAEQWAAERRADASA